MEDKNRENLLYVPKIEPDRDYRSDGQIPRDNIPETPEINEPQDSTPQDIYNDLAEIQELLKLTGVPSLLFLNETIERLKKRLSVAFPDGKTPEKQKGSDPTVPNLPPLDPNTPPSSPTMSTPTTPTTPAKKPSKPQVTMPEIKYKIPENPPPYIPPKPKLPGSTPGSTFTTSLPPTEDNPPENPARPIIEKIVNPPVDEWHVGRDYKDKVIDPVTHLPVDHETENPTDFTSDPKHITRTVESGTTDHHIYGIDEKPTANGASPVEVPNMYPHITNVVLDIATPRTLVQIIQDNYARDTINLQNYYLQKLQLILQKYFQEMLTIMAECNVDDIDKLTQDFDGEYVTVGDPNMRHLRDSVCRSQIMRDQKERFIKKMFNVDNTMLHMNKWHVAEQEREAYYAEEYGDSGTFLDSHANALLRDCRSQYDAAYNQSVYDMYKYLDSSCSALGDVLDMTSKEAQAKGQMLKKGVDIFKNRAVEEQRAEDERHEAELKELQRQRELNKDAKPVSMNGGQVTNGHISLEDSNSRSLGQSGGGSSGGARTPGSSAGGGGTCSSAQVEKAVQEAISIANSGCSYQMGGEGPDVYDCTGFISAAFSQAGWPIDVCHAGAFDNGFLSMGFVSIPYSDGNKDQLQRGDILVNNHHVELYIGGGQFAGAHSTASGVSVCNYFDNDWEEIYRFKG